MFGGFILLFNFLKRLGDKEHDLSFLNEEGRARRLVGIKNDIVFFVIIVLEIIPFIAEKDRPRRVYV
jgi:hypothetical protein